jgi:hypothetical protein
MGQEDAPGFFEVCDRRSDAAPYLERRRRPAGTLGMGNANSGRELSFELVMRVERLLKDRCPNAVAEALGIDDGTVAKIQRGQHSRQMQRSQYDRCGGCGGMTQMPCRLCGVRQAMRWGLAAGESDCG